MKTLLLTAALLITSLTNAQPFAAEMLKIFKGNLDTATVHCIMTSNGYTNLMYIKRPYVNTKGWGDAAPNIKRTHAEAHELGKDLAGFFG